MDDLKRMDAGLKLEPVYSRPRVSSGLLGGVVNWIVANTPGWKAANVRRVDVGALTIANMPYLNTTMPATNAFEAYQKAVHLSAAQRF